MGQTVQQRQLKVWAEALRHKVWCVMCGENEPAHPANACQKCLDTLPL